MSTQHPHPYVIRRIWLVLMACAAALLALFFSLRTAAQTAITPAAVDVNACAPIVANTTWASGVYTAENCNIVVPAGITLTLQAGVVIKFGGVGPGYGSAAGSTALIIDGVLVAQGTAAQPIVFTSLKDDAHGGDTHGDGASTGTAGDWYGLVWREGSRGDLNNFFVGYAGSGVFNATVGYGRGQIDVRRGDVQLRHGVVRNGRSKGIYLEGIDSTPLIEDVHIADNQASDGRGYAIFQDRINMQPSFVDLSFSGNDADKVMIDVGYAMTRSVSLGGAPFGFDCGYTLCLITVPQGSTLTVEPGTHLDFEAPFGINVTNGGTLLAEGTISQPITFTSSLAAGGASNQYWIGLWAQAGSTLRLNHCDISYASDTNFGKGGLQVDTGDAWVRNSRIHHNLHDGVYISSPTNGTIAPVFEQVESVDNGRIGLNLDPRFNSVLSVNWEGGSISRNGWAGVYAATSNAILNPTLRNVTISQNGSAGDNRARRGGISFEAGNINPVLDRLILDGNADAAIYWYCNGSITASKLSAQDNGQDIIRLPGCDVTGARQWNLGEAGLPVRVSGQINIAKDALLSLQPGTALYFSRNVYGSAIGIRVAGGGALYALGSAGHPIRFLGATPSPGAWLGIEVAYDQAAAWLRHCEIGYGGANNVASLYIHGHSEVSPSPIWVQNCEIHHSSKKGVLFDWAWTKPPVFRNNNVHDNTEEGVANWNAPTLDARANWWGDASGPYHAAQNPSGLGDPVSDNVLFDPWLTSETATTEPVAGDVFVSTGGPSLVSPGQATDYGVQVLNLLTQTVNSAVVVLQLPRAADFVEATHAGVYWPERHQVFWKLGNLAADTAVLVSARVRFQWGLPRDYQDGTLTLFVASNYASAALNLADYLNYDPSAVTGQQVLTQGEFDALRAANATLNTLYSRALAQGYSVLGAARQQFDDGDVIEGAVLRGADKRTVRTLTVSGDLTLATTVGADMLTLEDASGGMTMTLSTAQRVFWGDWSAVTGELSSVACSPARCKVNCVGKKITFSVVTSKIAKVFFWTLASGGTGSALSTGYEVYQLTKEIKECNQACNADPGAHCCTAGQVRWSVDRTLGIFGVNACIKEECNGTTGNYGTPGRIYCTASGQRCVAGDNAQGGCKDCDENSLARLENYLPLGRTQADVCAKGSDRCSDVALLQAKDPNALYGPVGDLLPGQPVTYTVTYENEGAGRAYGVYVVNDLPAQFDESTLAVQGNYFYLAEDRQLVWLVGELGAQGEADASGAVTYSVRLKDGLPSGSVIFNRATVYFPSVPEETPTNAVINQIAPLVALPQQVETNYAVPVVITLQGHDAADQPLTFSVVDNPLAGALTGSSPNLTYTPSANFTGVDAFTFRVSNAITTSRAAQIDIRVLPTGDPTPPSVMSITPAQGTEVTWSGDAVFVDGQGSAYAPTLRVNFSEAVVASSVNTSTLRLTRATGSPLSLRVAYDEQSRAAIAYPTQPLTAGTYTVTLGMGITDLSGNALAQPSVASFTVKGGEQYVYLPSVVK